MGTDTSYIWLCVALFVRGMGLGSVMMPTIAAAYTELGKDALTHAAPTLSAIQQVGASLGSALLVTALTQHLFGKLVERGMPSGSGGSGQISSVPPPLMPVVGPLFGLTAVIIVPAMFLPRHAARDREETPVAPGI
ncbi:hypothetical protein [Nocardia nova]|uniref:hypothetical protein n=1 Tax=Nocardia nova TaxID=37330 RepID=UPI00215883E0|nr:hypothetical protein [Nocardia nova]